LSLPPPMLVLDVSTRQTLSVVRSTQYAAPEYAVVVVVYDGVVTVPVGVKTVDNVVPVVDVVGRSVVVFVSVTPVVGVL